MEPWAVLFEILQGCQEALATEEWYDGIGNEEIGSITIRIKAVKMETF